MIVGALILVAIFAPSTFGSGSRQVDTNVGIQPLNEHKVKSAKIYDGDQRVDRSEEHTSELQSLYDLVCRLLLEKKYTKNLPLLVHSNLSVTNENLNIMLV